MTELYYYFGRRAFRYSSPATWNSITTSIKNCSKFQAPPQISPHSPAH